MLPWFCLLWLLCFWIFWFLKIYDFITQFRDQSTINYQIHPVGRISFTLLLLLCSLGLADMLLGSCFFWLCRRFCQFLAIPITFFLPGMLSTACCFSFGNRFCQFLAIPITFPLPVHSRLLAVSLLAIDSASFWQSRLLSSKSHWLQGYHLEIYNTINLHYYYSTLLKH